MAACVDLSPELQRIVDAYLALIAAGRAPRVAWREARHYRGPGLPLEHVLRQMSDEVEGRIAAKQMPQRARAAVLAAPVYAAALAVARAAARVQDAAAGPDLAAARERERDLRALHRQLRASGAGVGAGRPSGMTPQVARAAGKVAEALADVIDDTVLGLAVTAILDQRLDHTERLMDQAKSDPSDRIVDGRFQGDPEVERTLCHQARAQFARYLGAVISTRRMARLVAAVQDGAAGLETLAEDAAEEEDWLLRAHAEELSLDLPEINTDEILVLAAEPLHRVKDTACAEEEVDPEVLRQALQRAGLRLPRRPRRRPGDLLPSRSEQMTDDARAIYHPEEAARKQVQRANAEGRGAEVVDTWFRQADNFKAHSGDIGRARLGRHFSGHGDVQEEYLRGIAADAAKRGGK